MQDVEIIGMLKSYVKTTLVGMGALKGAPCQCVIATNQDGTHTVTMKWVDNEGDEHTDSFTVLNGQVGAVEDISDVQVTSLVNGQVLAWDSTAGKWVNVTNSASVESLANIGDVQFTALADGEVLTWDDTAGKWKNKVIPVDNALSNSSENPVQNKVVFAALADKADISDLGTAAAKDSTNAVTQNSEDLVESGAVYTELSGKADKATTLDGYGITNAYTKTETDSAIATEIGKLDSSDSAVAGSYVTAVSEADGKTTVTREAGDNTPIASSNKMVKSGGVFSSEQDIYEVMGQNGAKNLIPSYLTAIKNNNSTGTWNDSTYTLRDTTFLVNADGTVSVTRTQEDVSNADLWIVPYALEYTLPAGTYLLSGTPTQATLNCRLRIRKYVNSEWTNVGYDEGEGLEFTLAESTKIAVMVQAKAGDAFETLVLKPMVRLASDTDATYQPFAKTNQELTEEQGYFTDDQWAQVTALLT